MENYEKLLKLKPRLAPNVPVLVRNKSQFQIGLNPQTCLLLPRKFQRIIKECDGSKSIEKLLEYADQSGVDRTSAQATFKLLIDRQLLICELVGLKKLSKNQVSHLQEAKRATNSKIESIQKRSKTHLTIHGAGRLGTTLALLLGSSGFANLRIIDPKRVSNADLLPWGASRVDTGLRRDQVVHAMLERNHPDQIKATRQFETRVKPNLIIYCPDPISDFPVIDPRLADFAVSAEIAFLVAATCPKQSLVSDVLLPGISSCLRCYHCHQTDRDPIWPNLISQLIDRNMPDTTPADLILRTAFFTFNLICDWLDHQPEPSSRWWNLTKTSEQPFELYPHSKCGCQWNLSDDQVS